MVKMYEKRDNCSILSIILLVFQGSKLIFVSGCTQGGTFVPLISPIPGLSSQNENIAIQCFIYWLCAGVTFFVTLFTEVEVAGGGYLTNREAAE